MRYLLIALIAACDQGAARLPTTVVITDDLVDTRVLEVQLGEAPGVFSAGCDVASPLPRQDPKPGDVIIRCPDRLFLRFNCRGVPAEYPLSFVIGLQAFRVHCE